MATIHITTARRMMNAGEPIDVSCWTQKGELRHYKGCISLRYDMTAGTRNLKLADSGQIRKVRECCIYMVNGCEVFL